MKEKDWPKAQQSKARNIHQSIYNNQTRLSSYYVRVSPVQWKHYNTPKLYAYQIVEDQKQSFIRNFNPNRRKKSGVLVKLLGHNHHLKKYNHNNERNNYL